MFFAVSLNSVSSLLSQLHYEFSLVILLDKNTL